MPTSSVCRALQSVNSVPPAMVISAFVTFCEHTDSGRGWVSSRAGAGRRCECRGKGDERTSKSSQWNALTLGSDLLCWPLNGCARWSKNPRATASATCSALLSSGAGFFFFRGTTAAASADSGAISAAMVAQCSLTRRGSLRSALVRMGAVRARVRPPSAQCAARECAVR